MFFALYFSLLYALQASQMQNDLVASFSIYVLAVQCFFVFFNKCTVIRNQFIWNKNSNLNNNL